MSSTSVLIFAPQPQMSSTTTTPSLKLTYFDFTGRAEITRLALAIGGIPFEDERVGGETWRALRPTLPYKQMPVLSVDGRVVLAQSRAIARYAGSLAGLYPRDNLVDACRIDEIMDFDEDLYLSLSPTFDKSLDAATKKKRTDEIVATKLPEMYAMLEARLAASPSTGPWFLDAMSLADLVVYVNVMAFQSGDIDYVPTDICNKYPRLQAIYEAVRTHPVVAAWNASHPVTKYSE
ncbi:Aste57867_2984 [Aphanomyces stellatus]|uniref:Aste57867_2984 protein n=1 Tax=Aphanomyces stellatus TaxID=120398 RepID=A0A485KEF9_9STRA|nr:hypothetical protein As57867_002975 [Aphanomyces stellatus]VFT80166.1 Aste57867_2984 [Aphanomyces stellatus]